MHTDFLEGLLFLCTCISVDACVCMSLKPMPEVLDIREPPMVLYFYCCLSRARANLKVKAMTLKTGIAVFLLKEILLSEIMQDLMEPFKPLAENPWRRMKGSSFS